MKRGALTVQLLVALLVSALECTAAVVPRRSAAEVAASAARSVALRMNTLRASSAAAMAPAAETTEPTSYAKQEERAEKLVALEGEALRAQQQALKVLVMQQAELESQAKLLQAQQTKITAAVQIRADPQLALMPGVEGAAVSFLEWASAAFMYVLFVAIAAAIYGNYLTYPYAKHQMEDNVLKEGFSLGLFEGLRCEPDWRICCCSCFFLPIRWADTMSSPKVRYMKFWPALTAIAILQTLGAVTFGLAALLLMILFVNGRQRIREIYGLPHGSCSTICVDWATWCFCSPCAAMQEAMEIELIDPNRFQPPEFGDPPLPQASGLFAQQRAPPPQVPPLLNMPNKTAPSPRSSGDTTHSGRFGPVPREV